MKTLLTIWALAVVYPEQSARLACLGDAVWFEARHAVSSPMEQVAIAYSILDRHGDPCLARTDTGYPWRKKTPVVRTAAERAERYQATESAYLAMTGLVDRPIPERTVQFDRCNGDYKRAGRWKQGMTMVKMIGRTCFFKQTIAENVP